MTNDKQNMAQNWRCGGMTNAHPWWSYQIDQMQVPDDSDIQTANFEKIYIFPDCELTFKRWLYEGGSSYLKQSILNKQSVSK